MNSRTDTKPGFLSCMNKGFSMTFENGWTISVQFGPGNYCEHYMAAFHAPQEKDTWHSIMAEISAWNRHGQWYNFTTDTLCEGESTDVKGHCTTDEVANWIRLFAQSSRD